MTIQPGTIHAFESVNLYAKSSGFLLTQAVDIGSVVKKGDVLAIIDAPELQADVNEAEAAVRVAEATQGKLSAQIATAQAELKAAQAAVSEGEADLDRRKAVRQLDEKRLERATELFARKAVSRQDIDEHQYLLEQSTAAERTGKASIEKLKVQAEAADAKVKQTIADALVAESSLKLAEARAARAKVLFSFTKIVAPFDGVVVQRNFFPGDFVRSAVNGTDMPLLRVNRTDLMRVVVKVPDLDVPVLSAGDKAVVVIDALKGREFTGKVTRLGQSEDPSTRTMRTEIDISNPEGLLLDGMYGRVTIELTPPTEDLTIPSTAVMSHAQDGKGVVQVVEEGQIRHAKIQLGHDDGVTVLVPEGLEEADTVLVRPNRGLADGDPVLVIDSK
jgi:RND family efflux transporter MFP subunit